MPSRDVNAAERLAKTSWRGDNFLWIFLYMSFTRGTSTGFSFSVKERGLCLTR